MVILSLSEPPTSMLSELVPLIGVVCVCEEEFK